jgi:hypothetical protein
MNVRLSVSRSNRGKPAKILVPADVQRPTDSAADRDEESDPWVQGVTRVFSPWSIERLGYEESLAAGVFRFSEDRAVVLRRVPVGEGRGRAVRVTTSWLRPEKVERRSRP